MSRPRGEGEYRQEVDETDELTDEVCVLLPGKELVQVAPNMRAGGSHPKATSNQEWTGELCKIRRMVEFLVRQERALDVKTDVAVRWLVRMRDERRLEWG